jgi:hypothetical protein
VLVRWAERLRRQRWTGAEIAKTLQLAPSTVARYLRRCRLARLRALEPPPPVQRYQWAHPGDLLHLDVKKLGRIGRIGHRITGDRRSRVRGIGWEFVHVAIDDASRLAYVEVLADEGGATTAKFLWRALAWFRRHGIRVRRVLSDNGSGYVSQRFARLCRSAGLRHRRTRALHAAHQWQGGALHPDPAARVGLSPPLSDVHPAARRAARLALLLQSPPRPWSTSWPGTHHRFGGHEQQSRGSSHLGHCSRRHSTASCGVLNGRRLRHWD